MARHRAWRGFRAHRDSGGADDAQAFVKTSLGRLRDRQQSLVTTAWEANGRQVPAGLVPDLFLPFERLISAEVRQTRIG